MCINQTTRRATIFSTKDGKLRAGIKMNAKVKKQTIMNVDT